LRVSTLILTQVVDLRRNLSRLLESDHAGNDVVAMLDRYTQRMTELTHFPEEIKWDMLAASAFVTSVSSTTGKVHFY